MRKKMYALIWVTYQMSASNAVIFVNCESVLEILVVSGIHILTVFGRCHTIFSLELFTQVGG